MEKKPILENPKYWSRINKIANDLPFTTIDLYKKGKPPNSKQEKPAA
ncbi:MAG: hypothetical protein WCV41_04765 [Patescibacteria group bacterium]